MVGLAAFAAWLTEWKLTYWPAVGAAAGVIIVVVGIVLLYRKAKQQVIDIYVPLTQRMSAGRVAYADCMKLAQVERDRQKAELLNTRNRGLAAAKAKFEPRIAHTKQKRKELLAEVTAQSRTQMAQIEQDFSEGTALAKQTHESDTEQNERAHVEGRAAADERLKTRMEQAQSEYDAQWQSLSKRWLEGGGNAVGVMTRAVNDDRARFGRWGAGDYWDGWEPPATFSPIVRLGQTRIDLTQIEHAIPDDERLKLDAPDVFDIPAVATFPDQCSVLLQTGGDGRETALQTLRSFMLRLLTLIPPGKVRFTILDPVGLGQSFAGFMHLADYDEAMVGSRIWTEQRHIEQRLLDLTEHMEIVIQKYLRNEFDNIEQYNRQAGEIAEPYRFLVVADFPTNFNDASARRLASIVASGSRCGVYALVARDVRQQVPRGLQLADLEKRMVNLVHDPDLGRFVWKDGVYEPYPLTLDPAPEDEFLTTVLHSVGEAATDASRVEVPFATIAPKSEDEHWTYDSTRGIKIPLGRAGATKLQYIEIGQGTSQHVLLAGKTGSGKSTLLHAMITSAGLWYHPDELQMYLVDFKKGVEFKTYALNDMPHAIAVAIESDREFGLSVLHKLDAELKRRGQLFRQANVQDVPGFRAAHPDVTMPRLLLIIDEFQEFFTEDDKLAQDASLLLDRLVRQGRAFGIHVILGSQTLGGAYSLARSTIGQMAIRIALQCSETDSYLILSDDNAAARLLSRPGEAIYNASSGAVEGNSPFQISWLPDKERDGYLSGIREKCVETGYQRPETQIVFEGNLPGDIRRNKQLTALLDATHWPESPPDRPTVWLGEPIAIKEPTHAEFRRMSGQNLLIVGQRDDPCLAMMSAALIGLSAQYPKPESSGASGPRFLVLDGILEDDSRAGYLGKVCGVLRHRAEVVNWREIPDRLNEVSDLIEKRQSDAAGREAVTEPVFIVVHGLQRFRLLKKQEEDYSYSFSSSEEAAPAGPDKQFDRILRDGPSTGVHVLIWCDTVTNLSRMLDRNVLREIEMRVLFQMSINDSSHLMDSPEASRIGLRRALYFCEELGQLEKFRPYGLPDDEWLEHVAECFSLRQ
ncbi:MAG: cell division protein FtsK [Planctomycetes bacterium]|nr:cell division protein FtsK [Planctomycetota bacterium]